MRDMNYLLVGLAAVLMTACGCELKDTNVEWNPQHDLPAWAADAPGYYRPTQDLPVKEKIGPTQIPVYYSPQNYFFVRYPGEHEVNGTPHMAVWSSREEGRDWARYGYFGVEQTHFLYEAKEDGVYWIRFVGPGQGVTDIPNGLPHRIYVVDTVLPNVAVWVDKGSACVGDKIRVTWEATDANLQPCSINMGVAFSKFPNNVVWAELPDQLPPSGSMLVEVPVQAGDAGGMIIRVRAMDKADNTGVGLTGVIDVSCCCQPCCPVGEPLPPTVPPCLVQKEPPCPTQPPCPQPTPCLPHQPPCPQAKPPCPTVTPCPPVKPPCPQPTPCPQAKPPCPPAAPPAKPPCPCGGSHTPMRTEPVAPNTSALPQDAGCTMAQGPAFSSEIIPMAGEDDVQMKIVPFSATQASASCPMQTAPAAAPATQTQAQGQTVTPLEIIPMQAEPMNLEPMNTTSYSPPGPPAPTPPPSNVPRPQPQPQSRPLVVVPPPSSAPAQSQPTTQPVIRYEMINTSSQPQASASQPMPAPAAAPQPGVTPGVVMQPIPGSQTAQGQPAQPPEEVHQFQITYPMRRTTDIPEPVKPFDPIHQVEGTPDQKFGWPQPNAMFRGGTFRRLGWLPNSTADYPEVRLEFTENNGRTWELINMALKFGEMVHWTVPMVTSKNCKLRIVATARNGERLMLAESPRFTVHSLPPTTALGPKPIHSDNTAD